MSKFIVKSLLPEGKKAKNGKQARASFSLEQQRLREYEAQKNTLRTGGSKFGRR